MIAELAFGPYPLCKSGTEEAVCHASLDTLQPHKVPGIGPRAWYSPVACIEGKCLIELVADVAALDYGCYRVRRPDDNVVDHFGVIDVPSEVVEVSIRVEVVSCIDRMNVAEVVGKCVRRQFLVEIPELVEQVKHQPKGHPVRVWRIDQHKPIIVVRTEPSGQRVPESASGRWRIVRRQCRAVFRLAYHF